MPADAPDEDRYADTQEDQYQQQEVEESLGTPLKIDAPLVQPTSKYWYESIWRRCQCCHSSQIPCSVL